MTKLHREGVRKLAKLVRQSKVDVLRQIMKEKDWTQDDVAGKINCDQSFVSRVLRKERDPAWFWGELIRVTGSLDLQIAIIREEAEKHGIDPSLLGFKTEKAPAGTDAVALS